MAKAPIPLYCIPRVFYTVYYIKFAFSLLQPELAQEHTDFCAGCSLGSDAGKVSAAYETWGYFFVALVYTAVAQWGDDKAQRKVIQYGMGLSGAKLAVMIQFGEDALKTNAWYLGIAENLVLLLLAILTCYAWYKLKKPSKSTGKPELFTEKTAVRIAYIEQFLHFALTAYAISNGEADKLIPAGNGAFGSALTAASQFGLAVILAGVSQCGDDEQKKVIQYAMIKKCVELFFLTALAAPFIISAGGETGLTSAYAMAAWNVACLIHLMCCAYYGPANRAAFWCGAVICGFLGGLGLFFPSTAASFYRVNDLSSASPTVFKLIGLGLALIGTALYSFAKDKTMESFEQTYIWVYGVVLAYGTYSEVSFGLFSDLLNIFLLWSVWNNYALDFVGRTKQFLPGFLSKGIKKAHQATSPKAAPAGRKSNRGRSKTPGRKSQ